MKNMLCITKQYRSMYIAIAILAGMISAITLLCAFSVPAMAEDFVNPVVENRADPWVYKHTDGFYYFTATVPEYDRIELRRAATIQELGTTTPTVIWEKHETGIMGAHIWAPEIHFIDGKWYIYFAAGSADNIWAIRTYVLECEAENPVTGTWTEKGQLVTGDDEFVLDATTFEHNGTRYLVWSDEGPLTTKDNSLYIATMSDPWTLSSPKALISTPTYNWEKQVYSVNEGAAVLKRNGKIFMTYSASATDANYCIGLLTANDTSDLLDPASWTKSPEPVFQSSDISGQYGPGHNSFTVSADGTEDVLIYHARSYKEIVGDPLDNPDRHTRAQVFTWNDDGTPNFGVPVANNSIEAGYYKLIANHSGKVYSIEDGSMTYGASVVQWTDEDRDDQIWWIEKVDEDENGEYYKIINRKSSLALCVVDGLADDGANAHQWEFYGISFLDQQFSVKPLANGTYAFLFRHSGKALSVEGAGLDDGANVYQLEYAGGAEQQLILQPYTPSVVVPDALWYPLNEGEGDVATDAYGANDGAIIGGAAWTDEGHDGSALVLNGSAQYIDTQAALVDTTGDFSLSIWVKLASTGGWQTFMSQDGVNISGFYFQKHGTDNTFTFTMHTADSTTAGASSVSSALPVTANTWYHVVAIHDSVNDEISLYVNGELQGTSSFSSPWNVTGHTVIGRGKWGGNDQVDWVNGTLDDARIFRKALSETEVLSLYYGYHTWTSANFPTHFISHNGIGAQASITPTPSSEQANQWHMVPGLADPAGISFESVEYPGHYLRHFAFVLGLHENDGSDIFAADATFYQREGLAGSGVSFESYNFPGYYIRHFAYMLRVDEIADDDDLGKQDATFNAYAEPPTPVVIPNGTAEISIDLDDTGVVMSEDLYGIFFEDINYAADGGLYAELVQNRSFEYCESYDTSGDIANPLYAWSTVGSATMTVEDTAPLNDANTNYVMLTLSGEGGISNSGFDGIVLNAGALYDVSLYAKSASIGTLTVSLQSTGGTVYASAEISGATAEWQKFETVLSPSQSDTDARLVVTASGSGTMSMDMISLFPQDTFKGRKNGMRKDLAQVIANLQPNYMRFPGGCLVHGHGIDNSYRWKDTIGDVAERKPNFNTWGYHQTYGIGFYEYFVFSEDIGAEPLPILPVGVSCQARSPYEYVPMDEMDEWVQDALDLVEFANGDVTTTWGAVRAAMGHPEPFNLKYLGLSNEEADTTYFRERFELIYNAVNAAYPDLIIIGTVGPSSSGTEFEALWDFNTALGIDMVDEHYYNSVSWFLSNLGRYDSYDRSGPAVFIGEYASQGNTLNNAVAEAAYLTGVERNADIVKLAAYAPLLRHVNHTQWSAANLIWFNNTTVVKTPNYYVQQMYATNFGDVFVNSSVNYTAGDEEPEAETGTVGVATWLTQAEYDDVLVVDASENVLFQDDFSGTEGNWNDLSGTFDIVDGVYQQTGNDEPDWSVTNAVMDSETITYTLQAQKTGGDEGFLIIFGYEDQNNYYWWNLGGWGNTLHAIEQAVNGAKTTLVSTAGSIETGVWYDIKIVYNATGSIQCYLNDELIHNVTITNSELAVGASRDLVTGDLIVKMANSTQAAINATFNIAGGTIQADADLIVLSGSPTASNSIDAPDTIVPEATTINVGQVFEYEVPAMSVQVMRIKTGSGPVDPTPTPIPSAIPEPGTFMLFGGGLVGLLLSIGWLRHKRRR